jgi:hypothetical protein
MFINRILLDPNGVDGGGAAPAPAPAAAAPAAPTPAANDNGVRSTPNLNNAFDQLDKLLADNPPADKFADKPADKQQDPPPADKTEDDAPQDKAGDKTPDKSTDKPADKGKPEKAATLRENYERLKKDLADRDARLAKYQELEKTGKFGDEEKKAYEQKVQEAEKRRNELEEKIKFVDYKESAEYKEKYEKPLVDAYADGMKAAAQYKITDPATGEVRQATAEDFQAIMQIADPDAAASMIEELFGTGIKAANVAAARQKVLDAHAARASALEKFAKEGTTLRQQQIEQQQKAQAELAKTWQAERDAGMERLPQLFKPVEGDAKGNEVLETGYRLADLAFNALDVEGIAKLPQWIQERMVNGKLPPIEQAKLHAAIRNKAGAFDRVAYQNKQLTAQIAELQKQLDGFKSSQPDKGELGKTPAANVNLLESVDAQIERLVAGR